MRLQLSFSFSLTKGQCHFMNFMRSKLNFLCFSGHLNMLVFLATRNTAIYLFQKPQFHQEHAQKLSMTRADLYMAGRVCIKMANC